MGLELDTPASGSSIDLPTRKEDLSDLRLPGAFRAWVDFKADHLLEIANIGTLLPEKIVILADELSCLISKAISIDVEGNPVKYVQTEKLIQLRDIILGEGNRIIFMRHGEQSPPEWISSMSDPAIRKIRMMQNPFNREDSLTNRGFVDVFTTAFSLLYLQGNTRRNLHILSSENTRAKEIAEIVSTVIPGTIFSTEEGLNSISYRDEYDDPPVALEQLLEELPSGVMPWNPELVDKLCKRTISGLSQSEIIINIVADLMKKGTAKEGNDLIVVFTHTQQLTEVLRSTDRLQDPNIRFPELTMFAFGKDCVFQILPRGILTDQNTSQRYQLSLFNVNNLPGLL